MGRHSNLIFWDKSSGKIITASHLVTKDMSRQREVAPTLRYERPPSQERASLYNVPEEKFKELFLSLRENPGNFVTIEQWIIATFTGAGRHLCEELVLSSGLSSETAKTLSDSQAAEKLWQSINLIRLDDQYRPFMLNDLSRYSVLGIYPHSESDVKYFPSVNDLIEEYFRACEMQEQLNQLREKLKNDLAQELSKLDSRVKTASEHVLGTKEIDNLKRSGDLILANLTSIKAGQAVLETQNIFDGTEELLSIKLNPDLTSSQNAQHYYRQFAKVRARNSTAARSIEEAKDRRITLDKKLEQVLAAKDLYDLKQIKDSLSGKRPGSFAGGGAANKGGQRNTPGGQPQKPGKSKEKILSVQSTDGWTIYVGRNRMDNDYLLSRLAQPNDLWFHVLGQGGAHVLIRIPSSKQEPPARTIEEAAQIAARLSKAGHGAKVRVVYTQCKFVKKIAKDKPGLVRYEHERTLEVDTAKPMPKAMKQLFSKDN